jgi:hypothetical protein
MSLILKRASASRPSGQWQDEYYDVLADGKVVGRILERLALRDARTAVGTVDPPRSSVCLEWLHTAPRATLDEAKASFRDNWSRAKNELIGRWGPRFRTIQARFTASRTASGFRGTLRLR